MRGGLVLALFALALWGCQGGREHCVPLDAAGATWCLLPPVSAPPFSVLSEVQMRVPGREEVLLAQVENDALSLRAALLTPLGQRLVLVSLADERVTREPAGEAAMPDVRLLLMLVQLLRWPEDALAREAQARGLGFHAAGGSRELRDATGRLLARARCERAQCELDVPALEMRLQLFDLPRAEAANPIAAKAAPTHPLAPALGRSGLAREHDAWEAANPIAAKAAPTHPLVPSLGRSGLAREHDARQAAKPYTAKAVPTHRRNRLAPPSPRGGGLS